MHPYYGNVVSLSKGVKLQHCSGSSFYADQVFLSKNFHSRPGGRQKSLASQLLEELQSHSGLDDPHTQNPTCPDPIFWTPFLTRFRPEFDPILTSWGNLGSKLGQIQVEVGSERGSKSGWAEWDVGVGVHH